MINVLIACALIVWLFGGYADSPKPARSLAKRRINVMTGTQIGK